jgi:large subunit ribosomal protein L25
MKEVSLSGSPRENVGKKDAKAVRSSGNVPCVLYGSGEQTHFFASLIDLEKIVYTPNVYKINLDINGKKASAIIQERQHDAVTDKIRHIDFLEVSDKKPIKVSIPVKIKGAAPGVMAGGKLQQVFRKVKVIGLAKHIPDEITVDISNLQIGGAVRIKNIQIEGVNILDPANSVVVSVKMARGAKKAEATEAKK